MAHTQKPSGSKTGNGIPIAVSASPPKKTPNTKKNIRTTGVDTVFEFEAARREFERVYQGCIDSKLKGWRHLTDSKDPMTRDQIDLLLRVAQDIRTELPKTVATPTDMPIVCDPTEARRLVDFVLAASSIPSSASTSSSSSSSLSSPSSSSASPRLESCPNGLCFVVSSSEPSAFRALLTQTPWLKDWFHVCPIPVGDIWILRDRRVHRIVERKTTCDLTANYTRFQEQRVRCERFRDEHGMDSNMLELLVEYSDILELVRPFRMIPTILASMTTSYRWSTDKTTNLLDTILNLVSRIRCYLRDDVHLDDSQGWTHARRDDHQAIVAVQRIKANQLVRRLQKKNQTNHAAAGDPNEVEVAEGKEKAGDEEAKRRGKFTPADQRTARHEWIAQLTMVGMSTAEATAIASRFPDHHSLTAALRVDEHCLADVRIPSSTSSASSSSASVSSMVTSPPSSSSLSSSSTTTTTLLSTATATSACASILLSPTSRITTNANKSSKPRAEPALSVSSSSSSSSSLSLLSTQRAEEDTEAALLSNIHRSSNNPNKRKHTKIETTETDDDDNVTPDDARASVSVKRNKPLPPKRQWFSDLASSLRNTSPCPSSSSTKGDAPPPHRPASVASFSFSSSFPLRTPTSSSSSFSSSSSSSSSSSLSTSSPRLLSLSSRPLSARPPTSSSSHAASMSSSASSPSPSPSPLRSFVSLSSSTSVASSLTHSANTATSSSSARGTNAKDAQTTPVDHIRSAAVPIAPTTPTAVVTTITTAAVATSKDAAYAAKISAGRRMRMSAMEKVKEYYGPRVAAEGGQ